ncbi:hypothetical protein, partial [Pseudomonas syringae]|uniref:hypothetical protein n=1 Tax=Pseudomonas syringae TaxID=317 RepID=UPI00217E1719
NEIVKTEKSPAPRRGRKRMDASNEVRAVLRLPSIEDRQYDSATVALQAPDVKAALFDCEGAQARRDSISRKLCSGSTVVTVRDLERWEKALSDAKKVLMQIAPILERHPICASVVAHS